MSKPKLETTKDKIIQARISSSELDFYQKVCKDNHLNMSTLVRMALISFCKDK